LAKPLNPEHWQPLTYTDSSGNLVVQMFDAPQWGSVTPFALTKGDEFRSALEPLPFIYGSDEYAKQAQEIVALSAALTDEQKMIAEYWSDGSDPAQVIARWMSFAQFVSQRDHHTLDDDVKMFFSPVERHVRRQHRRLGREARIRFRSPRNRSAAPVPRQNDSFLGRSRQGHSRDGRFAMDSL
jgi:hypothetical protein